MIEFASARLHGVRKGLGAEFNNPRSFDCGAVDGAVRMRSQSLVFQLASP
jgi:hypothetical protein